ncbi:MAG TPA: DUF2905 domain-containing protein [Candidatus Binatia bacterium]|nr:DUF2905 domain-containing protein [Candidatus Binatia bacterium]
MDGLEPIGRTLLVVGLAIAGFGLLLIVAPKVPFVGRLPGDIRIERDGLVIFIPLATMLVVSVLLTILLNLLGGRGGR